MQYDYLVVGSGLSGAVFANRAMKMGKKCLILEKRNHVGGNIYSEVINGINVHCYGAHIFHTDNWRVWDYVNKFTRFNRYTNCPIANYNGELYNLPFNMNTFYKLWGVKTPKEAKDIIQVQRGKYANITPKNLEEQALKLVGKDIYQKLISGYTQKQWGKACDQLPPDIIRRIPVRFIFDNNYFNSQYQGIPDGGYTDMINKMLEGADLLLETEYLEKKTAYDKLADKVVYTGMLDAYFNYCFGNLEYRSLRFETENLSIENYQGVAVVNYTDLQIPYTRIIEHKHFEFGKQHNTVISKEFPQAWQPGLEPYYPIRDHKNTELYNKYLSLAKDEQNVLFLGRLAEYRYYDMDQVILNSLEVAEKEFIWKRY